MNSVTFDLALQPDPVFRAAIHGLRLACAYVRESPLYPGVPKEEDLQWDLTDTTVTLRYKDDDTLSLFMDSVLGEFPKGYAVPPGYTDDEDNLGIYRTAHAHRALTSSFSSDSPSVFIRRGCLVTKAVQEYYPQKAGDTLTTALGFLIREGREGTPDKAIQNQVNPHKRRVFKKLSAKGKVPPEGVTQTFTKTNSKGEEIKTTVLSFPRTPLTVGVSPSHLHQSYGIWNNKPPKLAEALDAFLLSFAALAYVHVPIHAGDYGMVSLALDAETFDEFDVYFDRYVNVGHNSFLMHTVNSSPEVAVMMLAGSLGLPQRTYHVLYNVGKRFATLFYDYTGRKERLMEVFKKAALEDVDPQGFLKELRQAKITKRGSRTITAYDLILENTEMGVPWYRGFSASTNREVVFKKDGFLKDIRDTLTRLALIMEEDPMENQIRRKMQKLYNIILSQFEPGADWARARKKTEDFVIKSNLRGITTRTTLLKALRTIVSKAGGGLGFTPEEIAYLEGMSPLLARETLIIGAQFTSTYLNEQGVYTKPDKGTPTSPDGKPSKVPQESNTNPDNM